MSVLASHARIALVAVAAAAAGGVLLVLALAAVLISLYLYLDTRASDSAILAVFGVIALMLGVIALLMARRSINRSVQVPAALELFGKEDANALPAAISTLCGMLVKSFVEGLVEEPEEKLEDTRAAARTPEQTPAERVNGTTSMFHH